MSAGVLLATAAGVVSLYAACFHGWVFAQYRPASEHLWVAVTALSAAVVCFGGAGLFGSPDPSASLVALRLQIAGAAGVTFGLLRFAATRFGIDAAWLLRSADLVCGTAVVLDVLAPGLLIALDRPPRLFHGFAEPFQHYELTTLATVLLVPVLAYLMTAMAFAVRALRRGQPGARPLVAALAIWLVAALADSAVGVGLADSPYLLSSGGYALLVITISAALMRDLVRSLDEAERLGDELQALARVRADALRAVDVQLARGEQLAAIGTLAAGVAHEINNPLAYVSANLNHLHKLAEHGDHDPAEVEEVLAECREGLARVSAIASDLLRMARHGASEREAVDLANVVRSVLPMIEREAAGRARIEAALAGPLPVVGSARLLGQVALNLVWNAIHAATDAADGARITVETRVEGGGAELRVADNGRGIPAELLEQLFETAFTTRSLGQGTGLGLALVRLIVHRHGGEIEVESAPGATCVTVRLPLQHAAEAA